MKRTAARATDDVDLLHGQFFLCIFEKNGQDFEIPEERRTASFAKI